jgi:hypothetical protein
MMSIRSGRETFVACQTGIPHFAAFSASESCERELEFRGFLFVLSPAEQRPDKYPDPGYAAGRRFTGVAIGDGDGNNLVDDGCRVKNLFGKGLGVLSFGLELFEAYRTCFTAELA